MWQSKYEAKLATLETQLQLSQQELTTTKECFTMVQTKKEETKANESAQQPPRNESAQLSSQLAEVLARMQNTQPTQPAQPPAVVHNQNNPHANYGYTYYRPY